MLHLSPIWFAGFFDGEGCIRIQHSRGSQFSLTCVIANTDLETMDMIHANFGGGWNEVKRYSTKHAPYKRLTWAGDAAVELIRLLFPYLLVKREQAALALAFVDARKSVYINGKKYDHAAVTMLADYAAQMRQLNARGPT